MYSLKPVGCTLGFIRLFKYSLASHRLENLIVSGPSGVLTLQTLVCTVIPNRSVLERITNQVSGSLSQTGTHVLRTISHCLAITSQSFLYSGPDNFSISIRGFIVSHQIGRQISPSFRPILNIESSALTFLIYCIVSSL